MNQRTGLFPLLALSGACLLASCDGPTDSTAKFNIGEFRALSLRCSIREVHRRIGLPARATANFYVAEPKTSHFEVKPLTWENLEKACAMKDAEVHLTYEHTLPGQLEPRIFEVGIENQRLQYKSERLMDGR